MATPPPPCPPSQEERRKARLSAALRENLKRRKLQARGRQGMQRGIQQGIQQGLQEEALPQTGDGATVKTDDLGAATAVVLPEMDDSKPK